MIKTKFMLGLTALLVALIIYPAGEVSAHKTKKKRATHKTVVVKKTHNTRCSHLPKWGHKVKSTPKSSVAIRFGSVKYHYHSGVFYKHHRGSFVISAPPCGLRIRTMPDGHRKIVISGRNYYYYYGTYYVYNKHHKEYQVVKAPVGAKAA